jgi:hypothetical protein
MHVLAEPGVIDDDVCGARRRGFSQRRGGRGDSRMGWSPGDNPSSCCFQAAIPSPIPWLLIAEYVDSNVKGATTYDSAVQKTRLNTGRR